MKTKKIIKDILLAVAISLFLFFTYAFFSLCRFSFYHPPTDFRSTIWECRELDIYHGIAPIRRMEVIK